MDRPQNFIIISTADWDNPFWTNKQHVAKTLSELGHRVVYFDSLGLRNPSKNSNRDLSRILTRLKRFFKKPRQIAENLVVFSPLVIPMHGNRYIAILNNCLMKIYIKYFEMTFFQGPVIYWTYNPLSNDFLFSDKIVYHCVDDLTAAPGLPIHKIQTDEKKLIEKAKISFVTSITLKQKFDNYGFSPKVHYFPNVVDHKHFSQKIDPSKKPQDLIDLKGPILGFIGAISSYKVDFKLIVYLSKMLPQCQIVLIGQVGEGQPDTNIGLIENLPNVTFLGPKNYKELPLYLKFFDVALLPCEINEYTRSMFPMKFFEYLAAQKKVVTTKLDSLVEYGDCCLIANNHEEFLDGVKQALEKSLEQFANLEKINQLVQEHTWEVRTNKMLRLIGL